MNKSSLIRKLGAILQTKKATKEEVKEAYKSLGETLKLNQEKEKMTIKDGKIVKATEPELFDVYLKQGFDDIMPFDEYKRQCEALGTEIIKEE